ncbi:MAG: hypothetical protein Q8P59_02705 [Dehalococcoidia bacterium]|nr:hypothetical protein [Dehalococcoidia bacterium]
MIKDMELGLDLLAEPLPGALDSSRAEGIILEQVEARDRFSWPVKNDAGCDRSIAPLVLKTVPKR